jgi:hypothetical protein
MDSALSKPNMGTLFYQCRAARIAKMETQTINLCPGSSFGIKTAKAFEQIGCLDKCGDNEITHTFHAGRMCKGGVEVNQCVSISFDPAVLICITCEKQHTLFKNGETPTALVISEQNFIPTLPGVGGRAAAWE